MSLFGWCVEICTAVSVCALLCGSRILGMAVSKALSSHWDESEKKMHSLLFLYYPTQGHADIMKPSFCYREWAARLQRLSAKWVSEKFYIHKHSHCAFWYFISSRLWYIFCMTVSSVLGRTCVMRVFFLNTSQGPFSDEKKKRNKNKIKLGLSLYTK